MDTPRTPHPNRIPACAALAGCALLVLYWGLTWAGLFDVAGGNARVADFEAAFPVADALAAALLGIAGLGLLRDRPFGRFALAAGASMVLYLGVLDATFYLGRVRFPLGSMEGAVQLAVILTCLGGGSFGLVSAWRRDPARERTAARSAPASPGPSGAPPMRLVAPAGWGGVVEGDPSPETAAKDRRTS